MRPDPKVPAFSMETPLRVAQALLQSLAVLLPFLLTCPPPPTPAPPETVQSADLDADRIPKKQNILQQMASNSPDLPAAFKKYGAAMRKDTGRPAQAGLSLQQKLDQASVKHLIGECCEFILQAFAASCE